MNRKRQRHNITMDNSVWELMEKRSYGNVSSQIEKLCKEWLNSGEDIEVLKKEVEETKSLLQVKENVLNEAMKQRKINDENQQLINDLMDTLWKVYKNEYENKCMPVSRIKEFSKLQGVTEDILIKRCKTEKMNVKNF